jgi:hypothetical protein
VDAIAEFFPNFEKKFPGGKLLKLLWGKALSRLAFQPASKK